MKKEQDRYLFKTKVSTGFDSRQVQDTSFKWGMSWYPEINYIDQSIRHFVWIINDYGYISIRNVSPEDYEYFREKEVPHQHIEDMLKEYGFRLFKDLPLWQQVKVSKRWEQIKDYKQKK